MKHVLGDMMFWGRTWVAALMLLATISMTSVSSADTLEECQSLEAGRAIKRANQDMQKLRKFGPVVKLQRSDTSVKESFDTIQRSIISAARQICGQLAEAAKGYTKDAAFHALSITKELGKLSSLEAVEADIVALAATSPAYIEQKEEWAKQMASAEVEVNRHIGRYVDKIRDIQGYPKRMRDQAFALVRRDISESVLQRTVAGDLLKTMYEHINATTLPSRPKIREDFERISELSS